jgi:hypothetical protein
LQAKEQESGRVQEINKGPNKRVKGKTKRIVTGGQNKRVTGDRKGVG